MKKFIQKVSNWLRSRVTAIVRGKGNGVKVKEMVVTDSLNPQLLSLNKMGDPLLLRIEEFIDEHYRVRLNLLSQQYEVGERGTERWTSVNGTLCNRILMELNRSGIILAKPYLVKTVIEGGTLATPYHPVRSYLESLPEWDGAGHTRKQRSKNTPLLPCQAKNKNRLLSKSHHVYLVSDNISAKPAPYSFK